MGHVDDAHHAEGDRKANGGQHQYRAERQSEIQSLSRAIHFQLLFDACHGFSGCSYQRSIVAAHGLLQGSAGFRVKAAGEGRYSSNVALLFHVIDGQSFGECSLNRFTFFGLYQFRQALSQTAAHAALEGASGGQTVTLIRALQINHRQDAFNLIAQGVVDANGVYVAAGHFTEVFAGECAFNGPVPAPVFQHDDELPTRFNTSQLVAGERFEPAPGALIATACDAVNNVFLRRK